MNRRFTGWHMLGVMLAMFGTIIAANFVMARSAITTFGGTVVDNSYVATAKYNGWLAEARAQGLLGWNIATRIDDARRVQVTVSSPAGQVDGSVRAVARHPLGRATDQELAFARGANGIYSSTTPLPAGRWLLNIVVTSGTDEGRFETDVTA